MSEPTRTAENEVWSRGRPKRRPPRWVRDDPEGTPATPSGPSGSEGVAREGTEPKATRKSAQRRREGHGEGQGELDNALDRPQEDSPW